MVKGQGRKHKTCKIIVGISEEKSSKGRVWRGEMTSPKY